MVRMKMIFMTMSAAAGTIAAAPARADDVDDIIRNLDLRSFANSVGYGRVPGKNTFADFGFVTSRKSAKGATLVRKEDGRSKSFVIVPGVPGDTKHVRVCFHDKFVVMPNSASPLRYHTTAALLILRSSHGLWTAQQFKGGFVDCRNDPAVP